MPLRVRLAAMTAGAICLLWTLAIGGVDAQEKTIGEWDDTVGSACRQNIRKASRVLDRTTLAGESVLNKVFALCETLPIYSKHAAG